MLNLLRPARSLTARGAAASLLTAAYAITPTPASARDIDGLPPQCAKAGDELAKLKCGRAVFQKQTADAKARSADAKARGAAADATMATARDTKSCMDSVTRDIQSASKIGPLKPEQVKAFESRISGCERS